MDTEDFISIATFSQITREKNLVIENMEILSTKRFLRNIAESKPLKFQESFDTLTPMIRKENDSSFVTSMTARFIFTSNAVEEVSTKTSADTENILMGHFSEYSQQDIINVLNTKKAMDYAREQFLNNTTNLCNIAPITVPMILDIHELVMKGEDFAGKTRDVDVSLCTNTTDMTKHVYPSGDISLSGLTAICDKVSSLLFVQTEGTISNIPNSFSAENIIKLSAWVHFMFLDLHPFQDGNGRVARILGFYFLMGLTSLPIPLFQAKNVEDITSEKKNYIKCLEQARADSPCNPAYLSRLIHKSILLAFDE